jgi:uncharacterized protein YbaA (DUF1428 family)
MHGSPGPGSRLARFEPRALRLDPDDRRRLEAQTERVLAAHPAWPWPLIEETARRRAERIGAARERLAEACPAKATRPALAAQQRERPLPSGADGVVRPRSPCDQSQREEACMSYVDGFVVAVPRQNLEAYKAMARKAGGVWKEHGALAFVECVGDDVPYGELTSFPRAVQAKEDEVVVFSWIVYESRAQRDAVNAKVMADPRLKAQMADMPFDGKRMIYGGFEAFLEL